jgi:hypothetical protein
MSKHVPQRMCVICRQSSSKDKLFRLVEKDGKVEVDFDQKEQSRAIYVCQSLNCLERLSKHKKYKVSMKSLSEMAVKIKKSEKNLLSILNSMKNGGNLVFGINMVKENIKKISLLIIASDISSKNQNTLIKLCKELKIKYIITASRRELGDIFSKEDVNTIGIIGKKAAQGLLN